MKHWIGICVLILTILAISFVVAANINVLLPSTNVRTLAEIYLKYTYYPWDKYFTAMSPEACTSIVWDFRGLDTVFETMVFYLAIIGAIALARGVPLKLPKEIKGEPGLSLIVKTVTKIAPVLIIAVAGSIALHGHLTPGGGFQGGATAAVAPVLILVVFSQFYLLKRGVNKNSMLLLRSIGLTGIGITAFAAVLIGLATGHYAFVLQNQPKPLAPDISLPAFVGGQLISGSLWFFNFFEFLAVAAGFTIVFLLITLPEKLAETKEEKRVAEGGEK